MSVWLLVLWFVTAPLPVVPSVHLTERACVQAFDRRGDGDLVGFECVEVEPPKEPA